MIINTIDRIIKLFSIYDLKIERSRFQRHFKNTIELLVSNNDNIIYAFGSEKQKNNEESEEEGLIEAFDLVNKSKVFEIKKLGRQFFENYGFAFLNNYIFALTCNAYYKIDNCNGNILEESNLPCKFLDEAIIISFQNELVSAAFMSSSKLLFIDKNKKMISFDFNDYFLKGTSVFLRNSNVLLPMRKDFKRILNDGSSSISMVWRLVEFSIQEMKIVKEIKINKALDFLGIVTDDNIVYGSCYSNIYGLDLNKQTIIWGLQFNSSYFSSLALLDDKHIIVPGNSNYVCFYDLNLYKENKNIDPFDPLNSREIKFLMDEFSPRCPLILLYNVFERDDTEIYLFYDLRNDKIIKKVNLGSNSYDYYSLCILNTNALFVESLQLKSYCLISIRDFKIVNQIKIGNKKLFKRISFNKFVISHHDESNLERVSIFQVNCNFQKIDCVKLYDILSDWDKIECYSINEANLVYKTNHSDQFNKFNFSTEKNQTFKFDFLIPYIQQKNFLCSTNGKYLVFYEKSEIYILNLQNISFKHKILLKPKTIDKLYFTDCLLVLFAICENTETQLLYLINPDQEEIILDKCLCFTQKMNKSNLYKVVKHAASDFVWIQYLIYSSRTYILSQLALYNINNVSMLVFNVDTEFKLKMNEIQLIGNGSYLLSKEFDKVNFIIFGLKEDKICLLNLQKTLFDEFKCNWSN